MENTYLIENGQEKDMMIMEIKYMNYLMVQDILENIMRIINLFMKVNIMMEEEMEKEKNIMIRMMNYYLKVNIYMEKDGMDKNINVKIMN